MATVEEFYERAGVVHGVNDAVCEVVTYHKASIWAVVRHMLGSIFATLLGVALIVIAVVTVYYVGFFLARGLEWKRPPLEQLWEHYNHVRIYEDGSYSGETKDGKQVSGCLSGGLCND